MDYLSSLFGYGSSSGSTGTSTGSSWLSDLSSLAKTGASVYSAVTGKTSPTGAPVAAGAPTAISSNLLLYVGIGAVALIAVIFALRKA